MQTILKHCTAVLSRIIFIGFSLQIVLGIFWMCNAFAGFTGPGEGIVCVGGMLLTGAVVRFVKRSICVEGDLWTDVFTVLSVLTFPFVMQSLVNPDVRIVLLNGLLGGMGGVCRIIRRNAMAAKSGKLRTACVILAFWVFSCGLMAGTDVIRNGWTPISVRLTERVAWTTLYGNYSKLSKGTRNAVNYFNMIESSYEATGIREVLVPYLERKVGEEQTRQVLNEYISVAWKNDKKKILKEIVWDAAGYGMSPLIVPLQLEGRAYDSYTGMNYRELLQPAPVLGKLYTNYSCWWFGVALVCAALLGVLRVLCAPLLQEKTQKSNQFGRWLLVGLTGLGIVLSYTLDGAGRMDYKNTLFVLCIWLIWMAGGVQDEKG